VWWWYFYEDPRQHPRITSAELAALPTTHATLAGSGPVPWRHLIPRVAPLMIVYFCQGWDHHAIGQQETGQRDDDTPD
jgi:hypothetical protein